MKRLLIAVAVVSVGMFVIGAETANAKGTSGGGRPGTGTTNTTKGPTSGAGRLEGRNLGKNLTKVDGIKRIDPNLPTNLGGSATKVLGPIGKTTPVTWGGNPPRGPNQGCNHNGCDHHGCDHHGCDRYCGWFYPGMCDADFWFFYNNCEFDAGN